MIDDDSWTPTDTKAAINWAKDYRERRMKDRLKWIIKSNICPDCAESGFTPPPKLVEVWPGLVACEECFRVFWRK